VNQSAGAPAEGKKVGRVSSCLLLASVLLGVVHSWMSCWAMNPDGMSYLDLGDSFFHRDWARAVNAWWSPLYPWLVGNAVGILKPSMKWEFPLVHAVNFGIFQVALLAFGYLLYTLLAHSRESAIGLGNAFAGMGLGSAGILNFLVDRAGGAIALQRRARSSGGRLLLSGGGDAASL